MPHGNGLRACTAVAFEQVHHRWAATAAIGDCAAGSLYVGERVGAAMNRFHDGALTHRFAMTHNGHLHTFRITSGLRRKATLTESVMSTCGDERQGPVER